MRKLETLVSEEVINDIKIIWKQRSPRVAATQLDGILRQSDGTALRDVDYDILFVGELTADIMAFKRTMRAYSNSVVGAHGSPSTPSLSDFKK